MDDMELDSEQLRKVAGGGDGLYERCYGIVPEQYRIKIIFATFVSKGTKEAIGNWDKMSILIIPAVSIAVGIYSYTKAERNRLSQAIGFAVMPGLFLGALAWCLLTGQFGIIFIDIAIVALVIACIYFGVIRFK